MAREKRFTIDERNGVGMLTTAFVIIDNETGVNYLFVNAGGGAGGLTPLLDAKGNVIVTR
ncbi:MAG: xylan 1,4-beta-xylosidase [Bacteroidales bacterium]|nr:xylan 1,4-beta-xylosidase [Bacteroidales bacterium]